MSDVIKNYLERAVYDYRFEKKQKLEEIKRAIEGLEYQEAIVLKARTRLNEMTHELSEINHAADVLGIELEVTGED